MAADSADVVIAGGGMAGLGLATQLIKGNPELNIVVVERNRFPVPDVTAKVGESTVEIGSRYLSHTLDLKQHFGEKHLQKFGLRCFFGGPQADFSGQDELGVSQRFALPTFQVERGVVENFLHDRLVAQGVRIVDGVSVDSLQLGSEQQQISVSGPSGNQQTFRSRWLVDTAGRRALIKSHLNLAKASPHRGNAIWFRVDKSIKIDDWSSNSDWRQRMQLEGKRWLSTNHLMGPGYWVWIIPLGSGATSIGLVMDDQAFAAADVDNYEAALRWFDRQHPCLAGALSDAKLLDFVVLRDYSYDSQKLFSSDGWAVAGEAGVFADPFYSPGADFIALANEIINHLILKERQGANIRRETNVLEFFFTNFFANTISVYTGQYGGFGDRKMMALKLVWDYTFYWGVLVLLYYKGAVTDVDTIRRFNKELQEAITANQTMQAQFRARAAQRRVLSPAGAFIDQYQLPVLHRVINQLADENITLAQALPASLSYLQQLAIYFTDMLKDDASTTISDAERELLGNYRHCVLV